MKIHVGAAAIAIAMCATVAHSQSLKDKEYFAGQEKYLADKVTFTNKKCESNVEVKFDWSTPPTPEERKIYSVTATARPRSRRCGAFASSPRLERTPSSRRSRA